MPIKHTLSTTRFEGYRRLPSDPDIKCLKRYVWNVTLSESLYSTLQFLEIALRNSIHSAATHYFQNEFWFDNPNLITNHRTLAAISQAKGSLTRANKQIEAGRVIAELHFGFWRTLFFNEYENRLWRHIIRDVFPSAPRRQRQRTVLGSRIHDAKELRNRISHHEPIWHWHDLPQRHDAILETIGWIDDDVKNLAHICDTFPTAHNINLDVNEAQLRALNL